MVLISFPKAILRYFNIILRLVRMKLHFTKPNKLVPSPIYSLIEVVILFILSLKNSKAVI